MDERNEKKEGRGEGKCGVIRNGGDESVGMRIG